jgi:hypothetical protein
MKKIILLLAMAAPLAFFSACSSSNDDHPYEVDTTPPAAPSGLTVLNGDKVVDIYWNNNTESDLAGYDVYSSSTYNGKYTLLGSTTKTHFTDDGVTNGYTYYYAVAAYDVNGNVSALSMDAVYTIPRPEGYNQIIMDYRQFPSTSGFSFANAQQLPYTDNNVDVYFEIYQGYAYVDIPVFTNATTRIEDMGVTTDILDIANAPTSGWAATNSVPANVGHTYVIETFDGNYAKLRISKVTNESITFDWSYQTVSGSTVLKTAIVKRGPRSDIKNPPHGK